MFQPLIYYLLTRICGSGKARYATTDARQYADYVVTDTPAPTLVPVVGKA